MTRIKLWIMSAVCIPIAGATGQTNYTEYNSQSQFQTEKTYHEVNSEWLFRAHETSIDVFGTISAGQDTINNLTGNRLQDDGELGAGVGLNHFFTRCLGLGVDAYSENTEGLFIDNASANIILRFPIENLHLAPYIYGGGGYQFEPGEVAFGQVGAGLELRFTRQIGLFVDARYVMTDGMDDFGMGRAGLRFAF